MGGAVLCGFAASIIVAKVQVCVGFGRCCRCLVADDFVCRGSVETSRTMILLLLIMLCQVCCMYVAWKILYLLLEVSVKGVGPVFFVNEMFQ
mmetsp:Transcript_30159/g.44351  ORF Transcript_30159/g.44351 Transcript_30159/m.44351 type:complete len:92 (-) Transcript_30159:29-304(-)